MEKQMCVTLPEKYIKSSLQTNEHNSPIILFHHIPRTAGTSFRRYVSQAFDRREINSVPYDISSGRPTHYPIAPSISLHDEHHAIDFDSEHIKIVMGHYDYSVAPGFDSVVLLRNPVERAWSEWSHHLVHTNSPTNWGKTTKHIKNFNAFINTEEGFARISNQQTAILCGSRWGKEKYSLQTAKENLFNSALVGSTEGYSQFCFDFSIRFNRKFYEPVHANFVTKSRITNRMYYFLEELNQDDLELYEFMKSPKTYSLKSPLI